MSSAEISRLPAVHTLRCWLLRTLPVEESDPDVMYTPTEIAVRYYAQNPPTRTQLTAVRRALRSLYHQGLVERYAVRDRGAPWRWVRTSTHPEDHSRDSRE